MDIVKDSLAGVPVLRVGNEIDHSFAETFKQAMHESLDGGSCLLVDLSTCAYVDSGGLAVLISTLNRLPDGGWIGIIGGTRNLRRLFEIVGLADHPAFRLFDNAAAAEQSLKEVPPSNK